MTCVHGKCANDVDPDLMLGLVGGDSPDVMLGTCQEHESAYYYLLSALEDPDHEVWTPHHDEFEMLAGVPQ